ncbi:MAG: BlaI/MecI/CopY family transcriptional regulator [Lachnospiraceae bacterium]|nr:BlaI/MecI/CopY family transcriptional regulator [Lachnospiraceae bacterium]
MEDNMGKRSIILQQSEWIIMEKLWEEHPRTIMQLYHELKVDPGWSKSTVNTLLGRMVDKGILYYEQGTKAKQYYPNVSRDDAALAETESLLERVYQGSVSMMMNTLVRKKDFSKEEITELYDILKGLEDDND